MLGWVDIRINVFIFLVVKSRSTECLLEADRRSHRAFSEAVGFLEYEPAMVYEGQSG